MMMSTCMQALLVILSTTACPVCAFAAPSAGRSFLPRIMMATQLPEFESEESYLEYLATVSTLPQGFATGTAIGKFVSREAPLLGDLPIRGTVIHLTDGPTESWAAVFTQNRVRYQYLPMNSYGSTFVSVRRVHLPRFISIVPWSSHYCGQITNGSRGSPSCDRY